MATPELVASTLVNEALELEGDIAPWYSYFDTSRGAPLSVTNQITLFAQGVREIVGTRNQWANVEHTPKPGAERY